MARYRRRNSKGRFSSFGRKHHRRSMKGFGRKHSRRSYKGLGKLGRLADFPTKADFLSRPVDGEGALMGVGVGLLGVLAANWYIQKQKTQKLNLMIAQAPWKGAAAALIGAAGAGILAFSFLHKGGGQKYTGWLVGATAAGLAVAGTRLIDSRYVGQTVFFPNYPKPSATVTATQGYGLLARQNGLKSYGMIQADRTKPKALAALSMALDDGDSIERVLGD